MNFSTYLFGIFRKGIEAHVANLLPMMTISEPTSRVVGAAPFVRALADHIELMDLLNRLLLWDAARTRISPGERIFAMILDLLMGKMPLYRVEDRLLETDVPLLFGVGRQAADYSDDSLGRALDKLAAADPKKVFTAVAAHAFTREHIRLQRLHWDSTSKSLYGGYPEAEDTAADATPEVLDAESSDVRKAPPAVPKRGYSKDHRPDLKQLILSVLVNGDGVICLGAVDAGNASDKTLNRRALAELADAFAPEALRDLVYVADSSLVTGENLTALRDMDLTFISRCPETFGAVADAKAAAWAADDWETVGTVAERRNAASYWASEQTAIIGETTYRFIVYRSSALDNRKAASLDREIAQAQDTLTRAAQALHRQTFQCEADAQAAAAAFQQRPEQRWFQSMPPTIAEHTERVTQGRGRPRKEAPVRTVWTITAPIGAVDADRRHAEWERRCTFALITTLPQETWDARAVLQEYKGQVVCERKFHFMKDPLFVNALFLKTPERLEALGYVVLMAALFYSLLERRLRESAVPIPSPSRRVLTRPTAHELFRHLRALQVTPQPDGSRAVSLPEPFHATFWAFLKALRLPDRYFTQPPPAPSS